MFDVYQEIRDDIIAHPWVYGAMAAEYAPGGLGFAASVANQSYHVVSGQSSIGKAAQDLSVDAITGIIGYKAVKGLGKAGKFVSGKFAAKLAQKRAAKIEEGIKKSGKSSEKKVQWTQREGQEWKEKVVGRAQRTGTPGHAFRSYREAVKEAKKPDTEKVFLNKGYNKATGQKIKSNRRPDVLIKKKDGTFHPREVPSKTDRIKDLKARNEEALGKLPEHMQGQYDRVDIK